MVTSSTSGCVPEPLCVVDSSARAVAAGRSVSEISSAWRSSSAPSSTWKVSTARSCQKPDNTTGKYEVAASGLAKW